MEKRTKKHAKNRRLTRGQDSLTMPEHVEKAAFRIVLGYEQFNIAAKSLIDTLGLHEMYKVRDIAALLKGTTEEMRAWAVGEAYERAERKMEVIREHPEILRRLFPVSVGGGEPSMYGYAVLEQLCIEYGRTRRHAAS